MKKVKVEVSRYVREFAIIEIEVGDTNSVSAEEIAKDKYENDDIDFDAWQPDYEHCPDFGSAQVI